MTADNAAFLARLVVAMGQGESAEILETARGFANGTGGKYFAALAKLTFDDATRAALDGSMTWRHLAMSTVTDAFNAPDRVELAEGIVKTLTLFSAWLVDIMEKNPEIRGWYEGVLQGAEDSE